ncbi:MAG: hypothetical protein ACK5R0_07170 [Bacteroidota bacterium]
MTFLKVRLRGKFAAGRQLDGNADSSRTIFKKFFGDRTFSVAGDSEQPLGHGAARNAVSKQDSKETSGTVDFFGTCDSDELM